VQKAALYKKAIYLNPEDGGRVFMQNTYIYSTAECECGDGLQTEEHIFWDCKLYEDQTAAVMDILSENSKKEYRKSVTELLRLEEKQFLLGVCYFINNIPIFVVTQDVGGSTELRSPSGSVIIQ
jgi:hypothetical protein